MSQITFITGNPKKAEYLSKYLSFPVSHQKIELDEIQSTDLREIVEHKVRQAYEKIWTPVLVEDVSLVFEDLGKLPGPFIKFFEKEIWLERLCKMIQSDNRCAIARCTFGYYDGTHLELFEWEILGTIANSPRWDGGFWWDKIFIPYFTTKTSAELDTVEYERFYTEEKPFRKIREFLEKNHSQSI